MKHWHNRVVKQFLYQKYVPGKAAICELGAGRGADVWRIGQNADEKSLKMLVAVDQDSNALQEYKQRWFNLGNCGHESLVDSVDFRTLEMDLTDKVDTERLYEQFDKTFDMVFANFSMHYFVDNVFQILNDIVKPGGFFCATLFDEQKVLDLLEEEFQKTGKREKIYLIDGEKQASIKKVEKEENVRDHYISVWMDSIGIEHEEPLVGIQEFIYSLEQTGNFQFIKGALFSDEMFQDMAEELKIDYGPENAMWSFTDCNCFIVFRRNDEKQSKSPLKKKSRLERSSSQSFSRSMSRSFSRSLSRSSMHSTYKEKKNGDREKDRRSSSPNFRVESPEYNSPRKKSPRKKSPGNIYFASPEFTAPDSP